MRRAPSLKNSLSLSRVGQHIAVGAAAERSATTRPKEGPKRAQRDLRAPGWVSAVLLKMVTPPGPESATGTWEVWYQEARGWPRLPGEVSLRFSSQCEPLSTWRG